MTSPARQVVQPNLTVNAPGDQYEQEADRVADAVMQMPEPSVSLSWLGLDSLLPQAPTVGRLPAISHLQTSGDGAFEVSPEIEANINQMRGGGQALPAEERTFFESRMGYDFSNVRVHTDTKAVQTSQTLSARAFTVGNDIAFNQGTYQPGTATGRHLLAHELTHVVQQGAAGVQRKRMSGGLGASIQKSQVLSYLQSAGRGPTDEENLVFRKEIAEFQRENPQGGIIGLQRQILDTQKTVDIEATDRSQTIRRKGKGKAPRLTKKTLSGPTTQDCGGFSWTIQWKLDKASPKGGWIVQKVDVESDIKKKNGAKVGTGFDAWVPYWEAWQVMPGQNVTVYADGTEATDCQDDTFSNPPFDADTKGQMAEKGTAEFYEGLTLPASFKADLTAPAGELRMTKADPGLSGGSGSIAHTLTATWDCTKADKSTTVATV